MWKSILLAMLAVTALCRAKEMPEWADQIRTDHPRLFLNADTWPAVRERALGAEAIWFKSTRARVDRARAQPAAAEPRDRGVAAAEAAFVYLVTQDDMYRQHALVALDEALAFYELRFEQKVSANWYSTTRVHAVLAWDWLYNTMSPETRAETMGRLVRVIDAVLKAKPRIHRENYSGYNTGFYGVKNVLWFLGCTVYGTGIEPERVTEWLVWGHDENLKMLAHRRKGCGDDGGGASPTLGYIFGAYPWSEQNFFYTWLSATGENIALDWPHSAWLANYVAWNWISSPAGPLEYGYGDTPHTTNTLPVWQLYTHMANIRHLYGRQMPEAAALAAFIQNSLAEKQRRHTSTWFVYPFLLTDADQPVPDLGAVRTPHARYFENMGQLFMRSGTGYDDTYALFTCGGALAQHRHFDALNFVLYHHGHQALDSGTRYREMENGEHLANYYAQTVAHNCVLIHQPDEPPARYWGGTVTQMHGGQHRQLGSVLTAFETNDLFTYVAGDATACYQHGGKSADGKTPLPQKATLVTRQMVFIMPDHFVICDRVIATDPAYTKQWVLHTAHEPIVEGKMFRADHREGRLICRTLLPDDVRIETVGGPDRKFEGGGTNWAINEGKLSPPQVAMMGQWRVEVTPAEARQEDVFLHVIQVGSQELETATPVETITQDGRVGVRLQTPRGSWAVEFNTAGNTGGRVRVNAGKTVLDRELTSEVTPQTGVVTVSGAEKGAPLRLLSEAPRMAPPQRMTLAEARARFKGSVVPPFWVGAWSKLVAQMQQVKRGVATSLAQTPGGRDITLVAYGELEKLQSEANFNSAVGARNPSAYADRAKRKRPVVFLVGPVHGHNTEGVTALANLIHLLEHGVDLRDRTHDSLLAAAQRCRLLIMPSGNPDGLARLEPEGMLGLARADVMFWGQGTHADGTFWGWPDCKARHPMRGGKGAFLGCYFNDSGINPMHDEFFAPMGPEARVILDTARREAPDAVVFLFGGGGRAGLMRSAYTPTLAQQRVADVAVLLSERLQAAGIPTAGVPVPAAEDHDPPAPFNLISATYHTCGAMCFGFTAPHGLRGSDGAAPSVTPEQILDSHLLLFELLFERLLKPE